MRCEDVREQLPAFVDAELHRPGEVDEHLAGCTECRAVLSSYRSMLGDLVTLAESGAAPPVTLAARVMESLPESSIRARIRGSVREHPVAFAAGIGGAALAAAAVAFAVRRARSADIAAASA